MELRAARTVFREKWAEFKKNLNLNTILALIILGLVVDKIFTSTQTILVPPNMTKEAKVAYNSADAVYFESWTMFLTGIISAVTPSNADEIYEYLEPFFTPDLWKEIGPQILNIKKNPKFTGVNIFSRFIVEKITYEPSTKKFFITGKLTSSQYKKGHMEDIRSVVATYEVKMRMHGYHPQATHWVTYVGNPMTEEWIEKYPEQYKKRIESMKVDDTELYPQAQESDIIQEKESGIIVAPPPAVSAEQATPASASAAAEAVQNQTQPATVPVQNQNLGIQIPETSSTDNDLL